MGEMADVKQETVCFIEESESEEPILSTNQKTVLTDQSQSCLNFETVSEKVPKRNFTQNENEVITNDELEKFEATFWQSNDQSKLSIESSKIRPFLLVGETSQGRIKDWFWETDGLDGQSRLACCSLKRCRDQMTAAGKSKFWKLKSKEESNHLRIESKWAQSI